MPVGQSAGYFKQVSYNDGTDDIFIMQQFKGLRNYGDKVLGDYERFAFPKEAKHFNAYGLGWKQRKPNTYLDDM